MPPRLRLLLIPLAAFVAVLPLLVHGCSCGHDLDFHLLSWQEAARQFAHGDLHPRWAFTPAWGAGEPRFVFYPPLSWTLGALLTLLAAALASLLHLDPAHLFALTPVAYTWLALTAAGLAMHHLARRFLPPGLALLAATLYLANPYTLFTAYERTAFAELLAAAWLPLLLAALLPTASEPRHLPIFRTAIPLALLWLTNAPAAVIGSYTVALITALRLLRRRRVPHISPERCGSAGRQYTLPGPAILALRAIAATTLALALAAFYIVPAVLERPWVNIRMAILPGLRPDDNTLFHHTADPAHDAVLHTASLLAVLLLTLTTLALIARLRTRPSPPELPLLAALTLAIALLLTPASLPLWHHLPELAFLQFPWRLLALLAPICVLAVTQTLTIDPPSRPNAKQSKKNLSSRPEAKRSEAALERPAVAPAQSATAVTPGLPNLAPELWIDRKATSLAWLALLLLPIALTLPAYHLFHQPCDDEDTPAARYALFRSPTGEEPTDEYTPATADNDALKDNNPGYRLLPATADDDTPPAPAANPSPAPLTLDLTLPAPALLILKLRDYPSWHVTRNGLPDPDRLHRADGLLTLPLPPGISHLHLTDQTPAPEYAADALSLAALLVIFVFAWRQTRSARDMIKPS